MSAIGRPAAHGGNEVDVSNSAKNFPPPSTGRAVSELVQAWRAEIREEWPGPGSLQLKSEDVERALESWAALNRERRELLHLLLGCEWLFRARTSSQADIDREVAKIRDGFGVIMNKASAWLLCETLREPLEKKLGGVRYLVSVGKWAIPGAVFPGMGGGSTLLEPLHVVRTRTGPVTKINVIAASAIAASVTSDASGHPNRPLGQRVASLLQGRPVAWSEVSRWLVRLEGSSLGTGPVSECQPGESPLLARLIEAWQRDFASSGWIGFSEERCLQQAESDPRISFKLAHSWAVISALYATSWGSDRQRSSS